MARFFYLLSLAVRFAVCSRESLESLEKTLANLPAARYSLQAIRYLRAMTVVLQVHAQVFWKA